MRATVKRLLPRSIRVGISRYLNSKRQEPYARLPIAEAFDRIYTSRAWAEGDDTPLTSGQGSTGRYIQEYRKTVNEVIQTHHVHKIADLGCGNFNTGALVSPLVPEYIGVDVARTVVERNIQVHGGENRKFLSADLTCDPLPPADLALIRQVLQHLTNREISAVLANVLRTYPLVLITEHLYIGRGFRPNLDIEHGPSTRVCLLSGVFVDQPPFSLRAEVVSELEPVGDSVLKSNEAMRTWLVKKT